jgi:hypothetical protein
VDEALAWCSHETEPNKACVACAIAASIKDRPTRVTESSIRVVRQEEWRDRG